MRTTSISIYDNVHQEIVEKQTEVMKAKNHKPKMISLNSYLVKKGLKEFDMEEFSKTCEQYEK